MLKENILRQIMVRSISKVDSFASSSDQVDIVSGILLSNLTCFNTFQPFSNRTCSIRWIPKRPNSLLVGGKHGELCLIPDVNRYTISGNDEKNLDMISQGIGPGGEIREIIPDATDNRNFYSLNVSGELVKVDMSTHDINVLQPQGDFNVWYAGLNVNFDKRVIMLGDNKGNVHLLPDSTRLGEGERSKIRCHKPGKINHIEFHPRDSNIMATAATTDMCVKLWDIRMLGDFRALEFLPHNRGVNSCYFNRTGHKIVTTDQENELRIYSSGDWSHIATITHPHRHFQYITPIRAEWHPLTDLIAVGNFPKSINHPKLVNFFDGRDGREIMSLENPNNKICSLNRFNYTGDILASMFQSEIVIWKQKASPDEKVYKKKIFRFRRNRRNNPSDSDNDSDNDKDSGSDSYSDSDSSSDDDDEDLGKTKGKGKGKGRGKSQAKSQGKSQGKVQEKVQGKGNKKVSKPAPKTKKNSPKKETRKLPPRNAKRKS